MMSKELQGLWEEARELSLGNRIQRLDSAPSALRFLRDFVSQNKPCIISNAISNWPALNLWPNHSYLRSALSNSLVSLHLTPDGSADSLVPLQKNPNSPEQDSMCFASAHVEHVPFSRALDLVLNTTNSPVVAYLQQQNDCFRVEYSALASDCDPHIPWATEAFGGCLPEAVNLWIGNHLSETSFHKDHYENLYAVISGEKHFLLLPPTEVHRMYIQDYPAAKYSRSPYSNCSNGNGNCCRGGDDGLLRLELEVEKPVRYVPWCSVNPYPSARTKEIEMSKYPLYFNGPKPFHCTVKAGDILYLPSMWFHHVQQSPDENGCAIAINYWYDMQFDIKYAYFNFLQSIDYDTSKGVFSKELRDDATKVEAGEANQDTGDG